jgi:DNA-3-methyladenine glycosylase
MRLDESFFARDARIVAKELLGKIIVRKIDNKCIKAKIVETEAYIGEIDKACHAYGNKKTKRTEPLYGKPGIAYVYFIYGMYYCFNVITKQEGKAEGVLIRAVEPMNELDTISLNRFNKNYEELTPYQKKNICNGPSKMAMALNITKQDTWVHMCTSNELYIDSVDKHEFEIIETKRIGIDYAEEAKDFLWRFYIKDSKFISKK